MKKALYLNETLLVQLLIMHDLPDDTFTKKEIEATGCKIEQVSYIAFAKLVQLRAALGKPITLMYGGIASGGHSSPAHPLGYAIDIAVFNVDHHKVLGHIMALGLDAFGYYFNGTCYSYHIEIWPNKATTYVRTWYWHKNKFRGNWVKQALCQ